MAATYSYNGSNQLTLTIDGLVDGDVYSFRAGDPDSSSDDQIASGGGASFTIDDIGGLSSGDTFSSALIHGGAGSTPGSITGDITYHTANLFEYGTGAGSEGAGDIDTYSYDGVDTYQVTFVAVGGVTYTVEAFTWDDYNSTTDGPFTDGSTQAISVTLTPGTPGDVVLVDRWRDDFSHIYSNRVFVDGVSGDGDPGNGGSGSVPYDNIEDALELDPGGGSGNFNFVGATTEATEDAIECGAGQPGAIWFKVDLSALVGTSLGQDIILDVTVSSGAAIPYIDPWYDPTGTFDPAAPDFSLLKFVNGEYYGDGTAAPGPMTMTLTPDNNPLFGDANPSGIYWLYVGDWNCTEQGAYDISWEAFGEAPSPVVTTDPADTITETTAKLHGTVDPNGTGDGEYWFEYGTTTGYGTETTHLTYSGSSTHALNATISSLTANTTYHFRLVIEPDAGGHFTGADRTFQTLVHTDPPDVTTTDPTDVTCDGCITFTGTVDPDQADTEWNIRYKVGSTFTGFGGFVGSVVVAGGTVTAGLGPTAVSKRLCLSPGKRYVYRIEASNRAGGDNGNEVTFDVPCCDIGDCAPQVVNAFDYDECTSPADGSPICGEDILRVHSGGISAFNTTVEWQRSQIGSVDRAAGSTCVDWFIQLREVGGTQGITDGVYEVRYDGTNLSVVLDDGGAGTILDSGAVALSDGAWLAFRRSGTTVEAWSAPALTGPWTLRADVTGGIDAYVSTPTAWPVWGTGRNPAPFDKDFSDCMPTLDSLGQVDHMESCCDLCPIGINKYEWLNQEWVFIDPCGGIPIADATAGAFTDCPGWFARMTIYPHGRFDCYNQVWNLGNGCGVDEFTQNYCYWFITEPNWTGTMNTIGSAHGFFVFDGGAYPSKIYGKLTEARAALLACDDEAVEYEGGSSEASMAGANFTGAFQVWRPVDILPGIMDNLRVGIACEEEILGPVSFSHIKIYKTGYVSVRA